MLGLFKSNFNLLNVEHDVKRIQNYQPRIHLRKKI